MMKVRQTLKEAATVEQAEQALRDCLADVPFLAISSVEREPFFKGWRPDLLVRLEMRDGERLLLGEYKSNGQPATARHAIAELRNRVTKLPNAYGVFIAPYLSPAAQELCAQAGVGSLDLVGNCRISFDQVYVRREGQPNGAARRSLRSLYSPKAERVLRVLLNPPPRSWRLTELAQVAGVSLGQAYNVKEQLEDREWMSNTPAGWQVRDPAALLDEWAANYRINRSRARQFFTLTPLPEVEAALAPACRTTGARGAWTGFAGAARLAPFVRYQRIAAYVDGNQDAVASAMGLKEVDSGGNVSLMEPYDEGVFHATREAEGVPIVSPVQIYLDVRQLASRGEEAAQVLRDRILEPGWAQ